MNYKIELETEQGEEHNVMNDKKESETEQGEEHKIKWWMMRNTEKVNKGKNTK